MIIDAHIHYTPPSLAADLDTFIAAEPFWGQMLAPRPDGQSLQGWATAERMIADMDAAGVDKVILMGEYRRSHEGCVARNDEALAIIRRWPDRVIAFAMIQPRAGQAALDELARCLDRGMAGVGELGPYGQGYWLDDPDFLRLAEACIGYDIPINLHTNEEVGGFYPGKATTPLRDYYRLANRYPELRLILAHWGGGLFFYELMPEVRRTLRNVWYDTAASPLQYATRSIFDVALRCVDHRKLLYASDYPLRLYPRRQAEPDFRPFLAEIAALGLPDDVRADILGGNAARWLRLGDDSTRAEHPFGDVRADGHAAYRATADEKAKSGQSGQSASAISRADGHAARGATADENEAAVGGRQTADGRLRTADGGRRSAVGIFRAGSEQSRSRDPGAVEGCGAVFSSVPHPSTTGRAPMRSSAQDASDGVTVTPAMSTLLVAEAWPGTRAVFERYDIPWHDSPVPFWEPISQAAAARGLGPDALARLVAELNEAAGSYPESRL